MTTLDPGLKAKMQAKVARSLIRLKHSLHADVEVFAITEAMKQVGSEGVVPQLETTLSELLSGDES